MRKEMILLGCILLASSMACAVEEAAGPKCTGSIVGADGAAVPGAAVRLYVIIDTDDIIRVSLAAQTRTAGDGSFVLAGTGADFERAGKAVVTATKDGLALGWADWHLYDREDLETVIMLAAPAYVSGMVVDGNDAPIAGAVVRACLVGAEYSGWRFAAGLALTDEAMRTTDEDGWFSFENIPPDVTMEFLVTAGGRAAVLTGALTRAAAKRQFAPGREDVKIVLAAEARIEGSVIEAATGEPKAGVRLMVEPSKTGGNPFARHAVASGVDGRFEVGGLAAGDYTVGLIKIQDGGEKLLASPVEVVLEPGGARTVAVRLEQGAKLEVKVRDETTDAPVGGAVVSLARRVKEAVQPVGETEKSGEDGTARFRVTSGEYIIRSVSAEGYRDSNVERVVVLEDGKTSLVDIPLAPVDMISGTVVDPAYKPVAGARVEVGPGQYHPDLCSGEDGAFEASWKTPKFADNRPIVPYAVARLVERNLAVRVMIPDIREALEVRMIPAVKLVGRIVDTGGKPVPYATATIWFEGDRWSPPIDPSFVKADEEGRYEIETVPDYCDYTLTGEAFDYATSEVTFTLYGESGETYEVSDIVLSPTDKFIAGVVVDESGNAVAGARVRAKGRGQFWVDARSDEEGRFRIEQLVEGTVEIRAAAPENLVCEYALADTGDEDVKIVLRKYTPQRLPAAPPEPAPLAGGPLPDMAALVGESGTESAEGKAVLVCFFDMEQRPSRYAVRKLAEASANLVEKNVTVIAVDTSGSEADAVKSWAAENDIPFAAAAGGEDIEATRAKWGVKALPWLVLADAGHIVRAEGFQPGELDEKVAGLTGEKGAE